MTTTSVHHVALSHAFAARVGVAYLVTWEDDRAQRLVEEVARAAPGQPAVYLWSVTDGLTQGGQPVAGGRDLVAALRHAARETGPGIYLFRDVHPYLDDPLVRRAIRDCFRVGQASSRTVVLSGPRVSLPEDLVREIVMFDLGLPTREELAVVVQAEVAQATPGAPLAGERLEVFVNAVSGLTLAEAGIAMRSAFLEGAPGEASALEAAIRFKQQVVLKLGVLEFVPARVREDQVGGLDDLKTWLTVRRRALGAAARAHRLAPPKGLLVMGMPGCGKSLSVQLVAGMWDLPLLRLDLSTVYSGVFGNPEASLHRALTVAEAVAPCVLWIDEIEKGIAGIGTGETGVIARVFGTFLTWMQEKKAPVFVAATANMIDLLPPEVLRKGRFDEVFFVDLPTPVERAGIWGIYLRRGAYPELRFSMDDLAKMTDQWTASEIEQAVINATLAALADNREPTDRDLLQAIGKIVPLAKTMIERIREIRRWASDRAASASSKSRA